jgi:hypothetical protein
MLESSEEMVRMIWMGWDQPNLVGRYFVPYRSAEIGWTVLYIKLWLPSGQWLGHISRYLHDFFEVPSQCLNIIIETNWFLSTTWSITTRISVSMVLAAWRRHPHQRSMHPHIPEYIHHVSEASSWCSNCIIKMISKTRCIITQMLVSVGPSAWCRRRRQRRMHPHIPGYLHHFSEASSQFAHSIMKINGMISKTRSIITQRSVFVGPSARRRHRRWRSMHLYIPKYLHDFSEASSQCSNWIIEINGMILKTRSIITWISVSVGPRARRRNWRRRSIHPHITE